MEGKLYVKVKVYVLFSMAASLSDSMVCYCKGDLALLLPVGKAGEKQLSRVHRWNS